MKKLHSAILTLCALCALGGAAQATVVVEDYAGGSGDDASIWLYCKPDCADREPTLFQGDTLNDVSRVLIDWRTRGLTFTDFEISNANPNTIVRFRNIWNEPGFILGTTDEDGFFSISAPWVMTDRYGFLTVGNKPFDMTKITAFGLALVSNVPEPSTWAMMIVGFGFAGAGLRRRRVAAIA